MPACRRWVSRGMWKRQRARLCCRLGLSVTPSLTIPMSAVGTMTSTMTLIVSLLACAR